MKFSDIITQEEESCADSRLIDEIVLPISTYLALDHVNGSNTCLVTSGVNVTYGVNDGRVKAVKARLSAAFPELAALPSGKRNAKDPFLLTSLISHETFIQSESLYKRSSAWLSRELEEIDAYAKARGPHNGDHLQDLTCELHIISQNLDGQVVSADISITQLDSMLDARQRLLAIEKASGSHHLSVAHDTTTYLRKAYETRKQLVFGLKQRKEAAMTLVYNLVAQQGIETSMGIARDTRNDSSSMKAIAILTMIFLPASAVATFFGMGFFSSDKNELQVAHQWWLFVVVTVPITALVMAIWWIWHMSQCQKGRRPSAVCNYRRDPGTLRRIQSKISRSMYWPSKIFSRIGRTLKGQGKDIEAF